MAAIKTLEKHTYSHFLKDKSVQGFIVRNVVFKTAYDAETRCDELELEPNRENLVYDPQKARSMATVTYPEISYMLQHIKEMLDTVSDELKRLVKQREDKEKEKASIGKQVDLEMLDEQIHMTIGNFRGLSAAWSVLNNRMYELYELKRLKIPPEKQNET